MAVANLLTLIDDIATMLDDVSVMTKVAMKKTAGVLGDDLALNAQQVTGVQVDRELPVVLAVAKGSAINKAILVPAALAISAFAPVLLTPLLMVGGSFLCFEGAEKVVHKFFHAEDEEEEVEVLDEKQKISGAVRTDFILSAEILVITLGSVATASLGTQLAVLVIMSVIVTVGVYGLVAGIVKLDDLGLRLFQTPDSHPSARFRKRTGQRILRAAPVLMKTLGIVGTIAMFLVGGEIIMHGVPALEHMVVGAADGMGDIAIVGPLFEGLTPIVLSGLIGLVWGAVLLAIYKGFKKAFGKKKA